MADQSRHQPLAWVLGIVLGLVAAPAFALAVLGPNAGFIARLQGALYPSVAMLSSNLDLNLVALAGGPSTAPQTTHSTSTPTKLTGGGQGQNTCGPNSQTPCSPRVFGFNVQITSGPSSELIRGHWNSQNPRCNGQVTAIFPQADPTNGFNFRVTCREGGIVDVKAEDNTPHSQPDKLDTDQNSAPPAPGEEPTNPIKNGNIKAHQ
jgi:hypothetical protein